MDQKSAEFREKGGAIYLKSGLDRPGGPRPSVLRPLYTLVLSHDNNW